MCKVKYDINRRCKLGMPHHPKSLALFKRLAELDFLFGADCLQWKYGGENMEMLMYQMDIYLEEHQPPHS